MKKIVLPFISLVVGVSLLLGAFGCAAPPPAPAPAPAPTPEVKTFKWRLQAHSAPILEQYKNIERFCDDVRAMSNGRLDITPYSGGALVPSVDIFSSTAEGVIEVGASAAPYHVGFMPHNLAVFAPQALRNADDLYTVWWLRGLKELYTNSYAENGVHLLTIKQSDYIPLLSAKKIERITDLKGMKIRSLSALAIMFKELGAETVFIPGGEVYQGLALGTVDAATWGGPGSLYNWKWFENAKYLMWPPLITASYGEEIYVDLDKWNELPSDLQAIMEMAAYKAYWDDRANLLAEDVEKLALMEATGLKVVKLPPEDVAVLQKAAEKVWTEIAGKSPEAKQAMKIITDYMREKGYTDYKIE